MLIVRFADKDYAITNHHDETVLGMSANIGAAFKQAQREAKAEALKPALAEAAARGDVKTARKLVAQIERAGSGKTTR